MLQRDNLYILKNQLASFMGKLSSKTIDDGEHVWSYLEGGDRTKPSIVFLHASMGYKTLWRGLMSHLVEDFHVLAVDIPGLYLGLRHKENVYDFGAQVRYLNSFLQAVGVFKTSIVGHSMGANIGAFFAIKHPEKIERLVLTSPSGLDLLADRNDFDRFFEYKQTLFFSNYDEFYKNQTMLFHQVPNVPRVILERRMKEVLQHRSFIIRVMDEMQDSVREVIEGLARIKSPTLAIHGAQDFLIKENTFEVLKKRLPGMKQIVLENCGHIPFLEYPRKTENIVCRFLKE